MGQPEATQVPHQESGELWKGGLSSHWLLLTGRQTVTQLTAPTTARPARVAS